MPAVTGLNGYPVSLLRGERIPHPRQVRGLLRQPVQECPQPPVGEPGRATTRPPQVPQINPIEALQITFYRMRMRLKALLDGPDSPRLAPTLRPIRSMNSPNSRFVGSRSSHTS